MKKKLTLLLTCSMALSLTACGGGNRAAETMATPETTATAVVEAAKEESRDDAAETTAAEVAGGDMDALIEATKTENELTVYDSCKEEYLSVACQNFEKLHEIKTKYQRLSTSEVYTEISEETDKSPADIWFGRTVDPYSGAVTNDLLIEYDTTNARNLVDGQCKNPTSCWYDIYKGILGFTVDTEGLDRLGLEALKTWNNPTKEECEGLIMLSNPNTAGAAKLSVNTMVRMEGHDEAMKYFKILDKNISRYIESSSDPSEMIGPGECVIDIGFLHDGVYQILQGCDNIRLIVSGNETSFGVGATTTFDGCARPDAVRLWIGCALLPDCVDHTERNGSYQFLILNDATQPEEATKFGPDMNSTVDYDFGDAEENSARYVEDFFAALGSSSDNADSSRFLTKQAGLLPVSDAWKCSVV